jgi:N utilization substance protein B
MAARHRSRQRALQVLYEHDIRGESLPDAVRHFYGTLHSEDDDACPADADAFMEQLAHGTVARSADIDKLISERSANWRLERMSVVDRNILRMAIYEMSEMETPPAVVIDEALELARQFSGDESVAFINGVLDAIRKGLEAERK